ncbi:hypothetical protein [Microbacterium sp. MYb66]|jgi:hypothetical protein|uniref:hypothetical protein n=1 Tax=Microbacterium sp. MYb66 TaxID=1848692 RepID=UPI000CFF8FDE|nr:hypothetical protein [Microbacterium sp. MYb66]PRA82338.1 hypothetical protein CQ045_06590 [Microbacterium sp. MYb66]
MDPWREIVGWAGSALLIVSILQPTISRLRWLNLGASAMLMAYNLMLGSAPMVALNITLIAINCWYLFVYTRSARAARVRPAVADGPSEASERHA